MDKQLVKLSKFLSLVLRHNPRKIGVHLALFWQEGDTDTQNMQFMFIRIHPLTQKQHSGKLCCQFSYVASLSNIHMIRLITLIQSVLSYQLKDSRLPLYE